MRGTIQEIAALKVGDSLFNFDGNRRVYRKGGGGAPIYREHFREEEIISETSMSWIVGPQKVKVNKKTLESSMKFADGGYFTKTGMEDDIWSKDHRYKIVREVERVGAEHLRQIARIVGYSSPCE